MKMHSLHEIIQHINLRTANRSTQITHQHNQPISHASKSITSNRSWYHIQSCSSRRPAPGGKVSRSFKSSSILDLLLCSHTSHGHSNLISSSPVVVGVIIRTITVGSSIPSSWIARRSVRARFCLRIFVAYAQSANLARAQNGYEIDTHLQPHQ